MGDQQFFLKWNDFQTNMVTSFRHLRDEKSFTDNIGERCEVEIGEIAHVGLRQYCGCKPFWVHYWAQASLQLEKAWGYTTMLLQCELVDKRVTLACEGQTCKAHKMVLSACSPYFKSLLEENPSKHPIIILKDVSYLHLQAILEFMYAGEVNVSQEQLPAFLKTAARLKVKGLAEPPPQMPSIKREG